MPNTLAHLGVNTLVTRGVLRRADVRWIFLGCVLPDLPWILQRVVRFAAPSLDPYDLRGYAIAQASLLCCLVLAGGLGLLASRPGRAFAILALGSALHLLLDALQLKWANGVHLFAPLSWTLWNQGLFWPESVPTAVLTAAGLACAAWALWSRPPERLELALRTRRVAGALLLIGLWAALPLGLRTGAEAADNHYVRTLRERGARAGRAVAFDRADFERREGGDVLVSYAGEVLAVASGGPTRSGTVSVRGRFRDPDTLVIEAVHEHRGFARDQASLVGLLLVAAVWCAPARAR